MTVLSLTCHPYVHTKGKLVLHLFFFCLFKNTHTQCEITNKTIKMITIKCDSLNYLVNDYKYCDATL